MGGSTPLETSPGTGSLSLHGAVSPPTAFSHSGALLIARSLSVIVFTIKIQLC